MMSTPILNPKDFGKLFLNGEYVEARSDKTLTLLNPKDNTVVADNVPIAGEEDVELAVRLAEDAFAGPWSSFSASQRTTCLLKLAELLESRLDDIMYLDSLTTGNPVSLMATREKGYIRSCVLYYGESRVGFPCLCFLFLPFFFFFFFLTGVFFYFFVLIFFSLLYTLLCR